MRHSCIYSGFLIVALAITFSAWAKTCFESTCHVDEDGTLWCNNQEITRGGHCQTCSEPYCAGCVNCDYTVPIDEGDEIVLDDQPFVRCGNETLPPQYYSGDTGGLSGDGDGDDAFRDSFYGDHSGWDTMRGNWWEQ